MREPDDELPRDEELRALLRSWEVEGAPPQVGARVREAYRSLAGERRGWRRLLAVPLRIPIPVALVLGVLLLVIGYLAGRSWPESGAPPPELAAAEAEVAGFPLVTQTQLAGFRPLIEVQVKVLPKEGTHEK
jgi:hypothetical protein